MISEISGKILAWLGHWQVPYVFMYVTTTSLYVMELEAIIGKETWGLTE
jgi:hypothetical protein